MFGDFPSRIPPKSPINPHVSGLKDPYRYTIPGMLSVSDAIRLPFSKPKFALKT